MKRKSVIGFSIKPQTDADARQLRAYLRAQYAGAENFMHEDTDGAFYLVEDDDFEPVADWYSSEIVLDMFTGLCNDLRAEGIHFGASVYGLSF